MPVLQVFLLLTGPGGFASPSPQPGTGPLADPTQEGSCMCNDIPTRHPRPPSALTGYQTLFLAQERQWQTWL